jgi:uncharacterized membrane protein YphA (DoxX/SURF4 family)
LEIVFSWGKFKLRHYRALGFVDVLFALTLVIDLGVAFLMLHKAASGMGELVFIYSAGYTALLIAGGGRFSADKALFGKSVKSGWSQSK